MGDVVPNKRGFRHPISEQEGGADQMWQASGWWDLVEMEMESRGWFRGGTEGIRGDIHLNRGILLAFSEVR